MAYIEGRIRTRSWEDKDGVTRYTTEVLADRFTMLGRKETMAETRHRQIMETMTICHSDGRDENDNR